MTEQPLSVIDPAAAVAGFEAAMAAARTGFPDAPVPGPDLVELPAGLSRDGQQVTTAVTRELTGADEEKIFRALMSRNPFHVRNTILECGVTQIGEEKASAAVLHELVIGDLDALLLGVYRMTYGDHIDIRRWRCPECGDLEDIGLDISEDISVRRLASPDDARFEVALRHGATATVRLPIGADQAAIAENPEWTMAEQNTRLLQRCVEQVTDARGITQVLSAFPNFARGMGIRDRRTILREIASRQPGPQYTDIKFHHNTCGKEVSLALDLAELFLGQV